MHHCSLPPSRREKVARRSLRFSALNVTVHLCLHLPVVVDLQAQPGQRTWVCNTRRAGTAFTWRGVDLIRDRTSAPWGQSAEAGRKHLGLLFRFFLMGLTGVKAAGVKYERPSENLSSCAEHEQEHNRREVSRVCLQVPDNTYNTRTQSAAWLILQLNKKLEINHRRCLKYRLQGFDVSTTTQGLYVGRAGDRILTAVL